MINQKLLTLQCAALSTGAARGDRPVRPPLHYATACCKPSNVIFSRSRCMTGRFGYNTWRDPLQPTAILEKLCKEAGLQEPIYEPGCVIVDEQRFYEMETVENEQGLLVLVLEK